jgi:hypothetical protein
MLRNSRLEQVYVRPYACSHRKGQMTDPQYIACPDFVESEQAMTFLSSFVHVKLVNQSQITLETQRHFSADRPTLIQG